MERTQYRYENTDKIEFLRNNTTVNKNTWFDEVFPDFEYEGKPPGSPEPVVEVEQEPEVVGRIEELSNLIKPRHMRPPTERLPFNLDAINSLEFKDREVICYIMDQCQTVGCVFRVIFEEEELTITYTLYKVKV